MIPKFLHRSVLTAIILLLAASSAFSQSDSIQITPKGNTTEPCEFFVTVKNRNAAAKPIDQVVFTILSGDGTTFGVTAAPQNWVAYFDPDFLSDTVKADDIAAFIQPGQSKAGFNFSYNGSEFDKPLAIHWETVYQGAIVSSGTINPMCTPFQSYSSLDTVSVFTQLSGPDPCFHFTIKNTNASISPEIYHMRFQLLSTSSGSIRPSKVKAPNGWMIDSLTSTTAYFSTDEQPINPDQGLSGFQVCLRANPNVTKHDFVWVALDREGALIDRDTIRNIAIQAQAGSIAEESDVVTASTVSGCLYQLTVKDYHISNLLPPSAITKVILTMQKSNFKFDAVPSAPVGWKKIFTDNTVTYTADSVKFGIQSGNISTDFRFSISGENNTDFTIGWETYRPAGLLSSGQFTTKCQSQAPRNDTATILKPNASAEPCKFQVTMKNLHNSPASDISSITLSIPAGKGSIVGSSSSSLWNFSSVSQTEIKFTSVTTGQSTGQNQDLIFSIDPTMPGEQLTLTWKTFEDVDGQKLLYSGTLPISCNPLIPSKPCDSTFATQDITDSCLYSFGIVSQNGSTVTALTLTPDNGWLIDNVATTPSGWTASVDPGNLFVTFTSSTGVVDGQTLAGFVVKFKGIGTTSVFNVNAVTSNQLAENCTHIIGIQCSPTVGVHSTPVEMGIADVILVPNPTTSSSDVSFVVKTNERLQIEVLDILGNVIAVAANQSFVAGTYRIPLSVDQQPAGSYYIRIQTQNGVITKRLVKQ